ncbi:MAG TPA: ACT domain-containing protein [Mycobacteriales bacterium]|nr:ACT domain-containing protein [Mycobacteriales bacterium]
MPAHLRVSLPDRPGSLAALSRALADAGANVCSVVVIDRDQGRAVDDLLLEWPYERSFETVVDVVAACPGTRLHGLRHVAALSPGSDCEAMRQVTTAPERAVETLVDALPHLLLADWAAVVDRRTPREAAYGTIGCPHPVPALLGTLDRPRSLSVGEQLALAPVRASSLLVLASRYAGPAFTRSEVDRLAGLVDVTTAIARAAYRPAVAAAPAAVTAHLLDGAPPRRVAS